MYEARYTPPEVRVKLTPLVTRDVALQVLSRDMGLPLHNVVTINPAGILVETVEVHGGSHGWDEDRELRTATELDRAVLLVYRALLAKKYVGT